MAENQHAISLTHLTKIYPVGDGFFTALKDINLTFRKGEFTGLVGPSGSGKTTLLNIIGSLDKPSEGTATVLGNNIGNLSSKESARLRNEELGFIFQSYNLLPVYSVYENIEFPLLLLNIEKEKRISMVNDALEWVGLMSQKNKRPAQLSGGESQRVAIARAIVKRPTLVLADEPTANLDAKNSHTILDLMVKLNEKLETTFIFATHDEKVMSYLKRQISLLDGSVAEDIQK
jgi:putative ABC transport system ATP-binding protein